jgi:hypothetical protein
MYGREYGHMAMWRGVGVCGGWTAACGCDVSVDCVCVRVIAQGAYVCAVAVLVSSRMDGRVLVCR